MYPIGRCVRAFISLLFRFFFHGYILSDTSWGSTLEFVTIRVRNYIIYIISLTHRKLLSSVAPSFFMFPKGQFISHFICVCEVDKLFGVERYYLNNYIISDKLHNRSSKFMDTLDTPIVCTGFIFRA